MKSIPLYTLLIVIGVIFLFLIGYYQFNDMKDNHKTNLVNEVVRAALYTSLDFGQTRVSEELFINKEDFEKEVTTLMEDKMPGSTIEIDYLLLPSGAIKAVETKILEDTGEIFSSTYKVNEALQGG